MRIEYRLRGNTDPKALRARAVRTLHLAMGRYLGAVSKVVVAVDLEGDAQRVRCTLTVKLKNGGDPLVVDALECDELSAIDFAATKLGRSITRRLNLRPGRNRRMSDAH